MNNALLLILLISFFFIAVSQLDEKESYENSLGRKKMKKLSLSLQKTQKFYRHLDIEDSSFSKSKESESTESESSEVTDVISDTEPVSTAEVTDKVFRPGNITETLDDIQDNRDSSVHFKKLYGYKSTKVENPKDPEKPILFEFYLRIQYINLEPYEIVSFELRIYKKTLRGLQDDNVESTKAVCALNNDLSIANVKYDCKADASEDAQNPSRITTETKTNFEFTTSDGKVEKTEAKNIDFSSSARTSLENIIEVKSTASEIVDLIDATYVTSSGSSKFIIQGQLTGDKRDQVAKKDKIEFTFHNESISGEPKKVSCSVQSNYVNDFQLICDPDNFKGNLWLYETSGIVDNEIDVFLMMNKGYEKINFASTQKDNKVSYKKSSSGLSSGIIALIVILSVLGLIIISVIALILNRQKYEINNNVSAVGLKVGDD